MPNIAQKAVRVRAGNGAIYEAKAVFVSCNWAGTDGPSVALALNPQQNAGISIDHVESVFIDNTKCNVPVTISSVNPPQTVTIVAGAVVNLHLDVSGLDNPLILATVGQANPFNVTTFIFRDYPTNASSTLLTGAASATTVTETDLAAAAQNDPADNHAAIRVQDLRSYNALAGISTILSGTLVTHDSVLDGIVSGGKLPVSDTATAQLAALIAAGRLAVSDSTLDGVVSGGKLAVSDATLEALIVAGKLAVADAIMEATVLGTGATSRLAAQLVDTTAAAFGTPANPLQVVTRSGPVGTRTVFRVGVSGNAGQARAAACSLVGGWLYNSLSGIVYLQFYDNTSASGAIAVTIPILAGAVLSLESLGVNFAVGCCYSATSDFPGATLISPTPSIFGTLIFV